MATLSLDPPHLSSPIATSQWMDVVSHLDPSYGGLSAAVPELASAVNRLGLAKARIAAFCAPDEHIPSSVGNPAFTNLDVSRWPIERKPWLLDRDLRGRFREAVESVDGLHLHGLWEQSTLSGARSARALRRPYVVSAHGMLEQWALENKKRKKQIYAALAERSNLDHAVCLHALTRAEADDYRRFGTRRPIAIIPNGVTVPPKVDSSLFYAQYPALQGKRIVLFLGRIHFKKGLDLLIHAWKHVASRWPDAHLVLAGPDSEDSQKAVETLVQEQGVVHRVSFTGMLRDSMKWSALAAAECFVLPSYSEGLSISTLEAMGLGLPVILTEQCNLPEVQELGAGWQVQSDTAQLASALQECLANSSQSNRRIGEVGRALVASRYTWTAVGAQISELYQTILGGSPPTSFELRSA